MLRMCIRSVAQQQSSKPCCCPNLVKVGRLKKQAVGNRTEVCVLHSGPARDAPPEVFLYQVDCVALLPSVDGLLL